MQSAAFWRQLRVCAARLVALLSLLVLLSVAVRCWLWLPGLPRSAPGAVLLWLLSLFSGVLRPGCPWLLPLLVVLLVLWLLFRGRARPARLAPALGLRRLRPARVGPLRPPSRACRGLVVLRCWVSSGLLPLVVRAARDLQPLGALRPMPSADPADRVTGHDPRENRADLIDSLQISP